MNKKEITELLDNVEQALQWVEKVQSNPAAPLQVRVAALKASVALLLLKVAAGSQLQ